MNDPVSTGKQWGAQSAGALSRGAGGLSVEGLTVTLGAGGPAVIDAASFAVGPGETLCVVGESGCGKSLTALALMGLLPSPPMRRVAGRALFQGRDLFQLPPAEMRALRGDLIAMIFQEPMTALNPAFTIGDQIAEAARRGGLAPAAANARAREMLGRVGIPDPAARMAAFPHQLSGGMRQRAMIAMALVNDPALVIADEPTTALDVTIQAQVLDLMRALQRESGAALILITHDLGVVAEMASDVAVMYAGRVVEAGPAERVLRDPQHPYTLGLMASTPGLGPAGGRLAAIPGLVPAAEAMPPGCRFAPRCPFAEGACAAAPPPDVEIDGRRVACIRAPLETLAGRAA
ncbi:ABC transporter ATP-binding protein [Rubrimonas cliftonensis]|uniref:Oligopeptide/dipeptide ABC transporter, ATP-binding protein, C-terminal domain-containing protein n=1 Tax=Rubrimonas cliftonensis TaxID=89524 RepID=A0A1H4AIT5_9RHOB|nr:ABC transporter ATP-binding protein [Rubrimonas cliftonensis]SEA35825.1 oligopeptide/dipeptide ABC transporter, ATP-binding protein, C-terminal domain-containing protein [Rubrimonas cliftonensis]